MKWPKTYCHCVAQFTNLCLCHFRYEGQWVDGIKQGAGKYTFGSGDVFTGNYENNVRHGEGKLVKVDGEERTENWKEGKLINFNITKEKKGK